MLPANTPPRLISEVGPTVISCEVEVVVAMSPLAEADKLVNVTVFTLIRTCRTHKTNFAREQRVTD
jgi:hypothetical protein